MCFQKLNILMIKFLVDLSHLHLHELIDRFLSVEFLPVIHSAAPLCVQLLLSLNVRHHQTGIEVSISTLVTQNCLVNQLSEGNTVQQNINWTVSILVSSSTILEECLIKLKTITEMTPPFQYSKQQKLKTRTWSLCCSYFTTNVGRQNK